MKKIIFKNNPIYDYLGYYFTVDKYLDLCVPHSRWPKGPTRITWCLDGFMAVSCPKRSDQFLLLG